LIVGIWMGIHEWDYRPTWCILRCLFGIAIGYVLGLISAIIIGECADKHWVCVDTQPMVNMRSSDGVTGSFFLGCSGINSISVYSYYRQLPDGGYRREIVKVGGVVATATVYEEDGRTDGVVKFYAQKFDSPKISKWADESFSRMCKFFIPKGSVRRGFDLQ